MPIKGLTDRESLRPQLARLGKLRKGAEKTDPKRPGKDLDHFRPDFNDAEVQRAFEDVYGKQPRVVNIVLFYETLEENFSSWIECWDASGLVFRSDGEYWHIWREGDTYKRGKKPHIDKEGQVEIGRFEFLVPELINQGFRGTVTLETHSNHDLRHISNMLHTIERERGSLRGTKLMMMRVEEEISVPGWGDREGKRSRTKKWLVKIKPPRQLFEAMLEAPIVEDRPALEAGDVDVATGEIIDVTPTPVADKAHPPQPAQSASAPAPAKKPKFTRVEIEERWATLWAQALALDLNPDDLPKTTPQMTNEELMEQGKALAAIVESARASRQESE